MLDIKCFVGVDVGSLFYISQRSQGQITINAT